MTVQPPAVDRGILTKLLEGVLPAPPDAVPRLVLVHARYADGESTLKVQRRRPDGESGPIYQVKITDQPSVLGVVDAWQQFRTDPASVDQVLVVTTGAGDDLGWELRGHALKHRVIPVEPAALVQARFQAPVADPRIAARPWLVDALLAAEPTTGWRPAGAVLTLDAAMQALVAARLGLDVDRRDGWDISQLLAWSRRPGACDLYATLAPAERDGIADWLGEQVGHGAALLLALAAAGRGRDAMALGVICSLADEPGVTAGTAMALGGLLGGVPHRPAELRGLARAVTGTLARWISDAVTRGGRHGEPGVRVLDVVRSADQLAATAGLTPALTGNTLLPSALDAQLRELAAALAAPRDLAAPEAAELARAEAALDVVAAHGLVQLDSRRLDVARMAVRLQRWLAHGAGEASGVAMGVSNHLAEWGWVDRALDLLWAGDPGGDGVVESVYRRVHDAARNRRGLLDEAFAAHLSTWATHACSQQPEGCLLIEDVMATIAVPLLDDGTPPPLILVLDGMSSAVAVELAEQLRDRAWLETSALPGRRRAAAVSMFPTITRVARASLLSGTATSGDQATEEEGFTSFWRRHARAGLLFHKGDLAGRAGQRLSDAVMQALAGPGVVGVVLNTVDDALDHGPEGDRAGWTIARVTHLTDLLDAARAYGRPVVLTADHGHVLERSEAGEGPTAAEGVQSARWRTGVARDGEIDVSGPRVKAGGGRVVLPWRETLRYTPRKAGYHGGASLAEVTVPALVVVPSPEQIPAGWTELTPADVVPGWWTGQLIEPEPVPLPAGDVRSWPEPRRRKGLPAQEESLFDVEPAADQPSTAPPPTGVAQPTSGAKPATGARPSGVVPSLGHLIVNSAVYGSQKAFVRKAPDKAEVAAVIDALVAASGTLPIGTVAVQASRAGRRSEQIVTTLERLLNVEGYLVLSRIDGGRTVRLDVALLRQQFGVQE